MDDRVSRLQTPEACERFVKNAVRADRQDLADQARRRAVELRAAAYGAKTEAERECLQAIYAYESVLFAKHGKRVRASRTWQTIETHGLIEAVDRIVSRAIETVGFHALQDLGLGHFAFEHVVLRHPELFSPKAIEMAGVRVGHDAPD